MASCPKLLPPETTDNYLIHTDYTYGRNPLVVRAENLEEFRESFSRKFQCVIRNGPTLLFTTPAMLDADMNVECMKERVSWGRGRGREQTAATVCPLSCAMQCFG